MLGKRASYVTMNRYKQFCIVGVVSDGTAGSLHMSIQEEVWPNLDHEHEVISLGLFTRKFCVLFPRY